MRWPIRWKASSIRGNVAVAQVGQDIGLDTNQYLADLVQRCAPGIR